MEVVPALFERQIFISNPLKTNCPIRRIGIFLGNN